MRSAMGMDKKVIDGRLRLVLARALGDAFVTEQVRSGCVRAIRSRPTAAYVKTSVRPSLEALGLTKNPFSEATDEFFGEGDRGRRLEEIASPGALVASPAGRHRRTRRRQVDAVSRAFERSGSRREGGAHQREPDERHARGAGRHHSGIWNGGAGQRRSALVDRTDRFARSGTDRRAPLLSGADRRRTSAGTASARAIAEVGRRRRRRRPSDGVLCRSVLRAIARQGFEAHRSSAELARDPTDAVHRRRVATLRRVPARAGGTAAIAPRSRRTNCR